jgi:hypothetical protein
LATASKYRFPYREIIGARIVLYAAGGLSNDQIAARVDTPRQIVHKWRKRFFEQRHDRSKATARLDDLEAPFGQVDTSVPSRLREAWLRAVLVSSGP